MTDPQLGVFMLILFVGLIMLGFPIAFTLDRHGRGICLAGIRWQLGTGHVVAGAAYLVGDDQ